MKAKIASLLVVLVLMTTQCMAQKKITVEAQNNDISYNLDLKAVASIFGDSRDLEEFEMRLNDYDSQISNLDLNNDGEVDYLRVIESAKNNVHVVIIQAVLDRDVFQDVATIVVEKNRRNKTYVQIIGDPYMYGDNYIIEPVYYRTPTILSFFWGRHYRTWYSPYYWGYYPSYYRYRNPFHVNIYLSHIHSHVNRNHHFRYSKNRRNNYSVNLQKSISRNDYSRRYPERSFRKRNVDVRNKKEIEVRNSGVSRSGRSRMESTRSVNPRVNRSNGSRVETNSTRRRSASPTRIGSSTIQRNSSSRTSNSEKNTRTVNPRSSNTRSVAPGSASRRTTSPTPSIRRNDKPRTIAPTRNTPKNVQSKARESKASESKSRKRSSSKDSKSTEKESRSSKNNSGRK